MQSGKRSARFRSTNYSDRAREESSALVATGSIGHDFPAGRSVRFKTRDGLSVGIQKLAFIAGNQRIGVGPQSWQRRRESRLYGHSQGVSALLRPFVLQNLLRKMLFLVKGDPKLAALVGGQSTGADPEFNCVIRLD